LALVLGDLLGSCAVLSVGDDLLLLGTNRRLFRSEGLPVDDIAVWCDVPAHHRFAQSEAGFDYQLRALAGRRVGCEEDSRDL
jgi:hypothetical protein